MGFEINLGERFTMRYSEKEQLSSGSIILEISEQANLVVSIPTYRIDTEHFVSGKKVVFEFCSGDGLYSFDVSILRVFSENGEHFMEVEIDSQVRRSQRREYHRYPLSVPVETKLLICREFLEIISAEQALSHYLGIVVEENNPEHENYFEVPEITEEQRQELEAFDENQLFLPQDEDFPVIQGQTIDISGGGMMFFSTLSYKEDSVISCLIHLDETPMELQAQVVRLLKSHDARFETKVCVRFLSLTEHKRKELLKYLFKVQIANRRQTEV